VDSAFFTTFQGRVLPAFSYTRFSVRAAGSLSPDRNADSPTSCRRLRNKV